MAKRRVWEDLFRKNKSGKIQLWKIWTEGSTIYTQSGTTEAKAKMRISSDTIKSGKSIGKKNETTPEEQAQAEAQSRFQKQLDRGFVTSEEEAKAGRTAIDAGGFFPMLAESFDKRGKDIMWPAYVQPKLDGLRATWDGKAFHSRARKPFPALQHLADELKRLGIDEYLFDGEIYLHSMKDQFEEIVSAVKRNKSDNPLTKTLQYHIYDIAAPELTQNERVELLYALEPIFNESKFLKLVPTHLTMDEKGARKFYDKWVDDGYEGAMLRNRKGTYEYRRSKNLQKMKEFEDAEFPIVGVNEGRGLLQGCVGAFVCMHGKNSFEVKMKGAGVTAFLKKAWEDDSIWKGKSMTVQFQGYTNKNGVPRFPVGLRIREEE